MAPRWVRAVLATLAMVALGGRVAALAAPEYRSLSDGYAWPACVTLTFVLNPDTLPAGVDAASVHEDLQAAADRVNAAVGRQLVAIDPGATTTLQDGKDRIQTVLFGDLGVPDDDPRITVSGYASTTWQTFADGTGQIVDADVVLDDTDWAQAPADLRAVTVAHEFGHALGLDHVGDAHEVMSYGFIDDGTLGPGTTTALRQLYTGTDCTTRRTLTESHDWSGLAPGGPQAQARTWGTSAHDVRSLAIELAHRLDQARGGGGFTHAVVCRDDLYADCLAGAALAGEQAPILFVPGGPAGQLAATDDTVRYLLGALPPSAPVYVLGGELAVSDPVVDVLRGFWPQTHRIAGADRHATAAAIAHEVVRRGGDASTVLVARSDFFADAVTAGAAAAHLGHPILLTEPGRLTPATAQALADLGTSRTLVLGGELAIAPTTVDQLRAAGRNPERVAGHSRTGTSVAIARHPELWNRTELHDGDTLVGLNGWHEQTWAVALATAPVAAYLGAPILLTDPDGVPYAAPTPAYPGGDTGYYLSHLPGTGTVTTVFVGAPTWAGEHARSSFPRYVGLY